MTMMRLPVIIMLLSTAPVYAQNARPPNPAKTDLPIRIEIKSSWNGLAAPLRKMVTVTGQDGRYESEGRSIRAEAVEELLAALDAPVTQQPSLEECGADETWRSANYAEALADVTHRKISQLSLKQIELFRSQFVGSHTAQADF